MKIEIMAERTYFESTESADQHRKWVVVDAAGKVVGRVASQVASILRGKHNPRYTKHTDTGDFVIVVNAEKLRFTGKKNDQKIYFQHTGFIGGMRKDVAGELLATDPEEVLRRAVQGMLPKNPLGRKQLKKLKVYRGPEHVHAVQNPVARSV